MTQSETYLGNYSRNLGSLCAQPLPIPGEYYKINESSTFQLRFLSPVGVSVDSLDTKLEAKQWCRL